MAKKIMLLIGLAVICFFGMQPLAFAQGLHEIHAEIQKQGARWQAGDTSMSRLSFAEQQKRLGLVRPVLTGKEPRLSLEAAPPVELPTSLDWRNNGGNFVTPIRDQGGCGSCWAFATTAALESNTLISNQTPGVDLNLAEQVLVSCGNSGSCNGGSIGTASDFFKNTGLPVETCYPYTATNGSCSSSCSNWQSSGYRISSWQYVATSSPTVEAIKNALYNYGPLVTTMAVYQDFFSYHTGVYSYVSGTLAGYHAVMIVGYDEPGQYFIVKNSWGTWWGEAGYFRIAYSELNSVVGFGDWTIAYAGTPSACSYSVSQPSSIAGSGGNGSVNINTSSGCPWTASSSADWVSITSAANGSGPGTVYFSVSANPGSSSRTGSLRVAGQTVTLSQAAGVSCTYSINPTQQNPTASGGGASVGVTTVSGCPWTSASNASWISITFGSSGNGSGTVLYSVAGNSSTSSRTGTLTIAGQTHTVTQGGISCSYAIAPTSSPVSSSGGAGSVNVTATSGCSWTAVSGAAWITVTSGASGSGSGTVGYSAAANTTINPRTGTLTIGGQTFTVSQGGISCSYAIAPTSSSVSVSGGTSSVNVTAPGGCNWTALSNAGWITVSPGSRSGNVTVSYTVAANTTTTSRIGTLTIGGQTFTVTQAGISCTYDISPAFQSFAASGGVGSVSVTTPGGCNWSAASNNSWIAVASSSTRAGASGVSYSVQPNNSSSSRTGTMTIAGKTFSVTQAAAGGVPDISVVPSVIDFGNLRVGRQASKIVKVTNAGNGPLTITSVAVFGSSTDSFKESHRCTSIAPGASCDITVTFAPNRTGSKGAGLRIYSNDSDENPVNVLLSGGATGTFGTR